MTTANPAGGRRAALSPGCVRRTSRQELGKFAGVHAGNGTIDSELTRWLKFFTEGEHLDPDTLRDWMQTREMRQAMSTLTTFSDKDRQYHACQARMNYLRQQRSLQRRLEELEAAAERERAGKEAALAEVERLRRLLDEQQHGA